MKNLGMSDFERDYLLELATEYKKIADTEENKSKIQNWYDINDLKPNAKPLFMNHYWPAALNEVFPEDSYKCKSQAALKYEKHFKTRMFYIKELGDDNVVEPVIAAHFGYNIDQFGGLPSKKMIRSAEDDGSGAYELAPIIIKPEDIALIKDPILKYNKDVAEEIFEQTQEIFEPVLTVVKRAAAWGSKLADQFTWFRGMEQAYIDMVDDPEWVHELLETIADKYKKGLDLLVNNGLWGNYDLSDPLGSSSGLKYATGIKDYKDVKPGDYFKDKIPLDKSWGGSIAEAFTCVSNDMHEEFSYMYDRKLNECFKYINVGCCEVLGHKVDLIRKFRNARKISISEWNKYELAAKNIGRDFVYSYKPAGVPFLGENLDKVAVEREIRGVLEAVKKYNCNAELVLNIGGTLGVNPHKKIREWSDLTRRLIEEYYQ
ncbi:hypothetical protein [Candidatus Epulonipiscium viviparus]|uniref:hypothetical protein n=1 Tax=Candidatus Epulonipiscium viviparus TaxID=420336 RepID=UPI0004974ADA|nr:hypothetical protein [Candidatus Epulopiscium viviparus]